MTSGYARELMTAVIDQLRKELVIKSTHKRGKDAITLIHGSIDDIDCTLFSGSVLTTLVNNVANLLIARSVYERRCTTCAEIVAAAADVGYVVTMDECDKFENMQFLKHSPFVNDDGVVLPFVNLGVLLRSLGQCNGDLPGTRNDDLRSRAQKFTSGYLNCFRYSGQSALFRALACKWCADTDEGVNTFYFRMKSDRVYDVPDGAVCAR